MSSLDLDHPMVTVEQWENFTPQDHKTWSCLFKRQSFLLKNRAAFEIIQGLEKLEIGPHQIPKFTHLNKILQKETDFAMIPVKGFIPADLFFKFLSERKFPSTCFIRKPSQLDYLEEPDIFHDVFGHVPLLINPIFADFMQQFGLKGLEAINHGLLDFITALYWFTVEFGLIKTSKGLRVYGAGITSSKNETLYALDSPKPQRLTFDLLNVMKTVYRTDILQETYFVIQHFSQLFEIVNTLNWDDLKKQQLSV